MNPPETSTEKEMKFDQGNHHQFTDDDLMRLFQIMEEDAETQVHMSQVSKVAALEDEISVPISVPFLAESSGITKHQALLCCGISGVQRLY